MRNGIILLCFFMFGAFLSKDANATHLMGGQITAEHISGLEYKVVLTLYRDTRGVSIGSSKSVDLHSGAWPGSTTYISSHSSSSWIEQNDLGNNTEEYIWEINVTLPDTGIYSIRWTECCRNNAILNMSNPGSEDLTLWTVLGVPDTAGSNLNNTPVFLNRPVGLVPLDSPWTYNPLPFNGDGDSLVWSFNTPQDNSGDVSGYFLPPSNPGGPLALNPKTGEITWTADSLGNWVISIQVDEYRNGEYLGTIVRDMQFTVVDAGNQISPDFNETNLPPDNEFCFDPGDTINIPITAKDVNGDTVTLSASGAPFGMSPPATFATVKGDSIVTQTFSWVAPANMGDYIVTFRAVDDGVPSLSQDLTIVIKDTICSPVTTVTADFSASDTLICPGDTVFFTDQSTNATSWSWSFPGGTPDTSTAQNPVVVYDNNTNTDLIHDVTLIASNGTDSDTLTKSDLIEVIGGVNADFTMSDSIACNGASISFTDQSTNATAWKWIINGGTPSSSTNQDVTADFNNAGIFDISLIAFNMCASDTINKMVTIEEQPEAGFRAADPAVCFGQSICAGDTIGFIDTSKAVNNRKWLFQGGTPSTSDDEFPDVIYDNSGAYDVTLIAGNSCGTDTVVTSSYVKVSETDASFSYLANGLDAMFAVDNPGNDATYNWDFGDGNASDLVNPGHSFLAEGDYDCCLIVVNECGADTVCQVVSITSTGLSEADPADQIKIYPVPARDEVNIAGNGLNISKVRVIDLLGKEVINTSFTDQETTTVNTSQLTEGVYFLMILSDKGSITRKINIVE